MIRLSVVTWLDETIRMKVCLFYYVINLQTNVHLLTSLTQQTRKSVDVGNILGMGFLEWCMYVRNCNRLNVENLKIINQSKIIQSKHTSHIISASMVY